MRTRLYTHTRRIGESSGCAHSVHLFPRSTHGIPENTSSNLFPSQQADYPTAKQLQVKVNREGAKNSMHVGPTEYI